MKRRPFIHLLGSNLIGLPLAMRSAGFFEPQANWERWLAQLQLDDQVESVNKRLVAINLPAEPASVHSGEFSKINDQVFFYHKRQYCFQVFEKKHPQAGNIDLLVPFWKKQPDASWVQITCLSAFGLEALHKACQSGYLATQVLPFETGTCGNFQSKLGQVQIKTYIQLDGMAQTLIQINHQGKTIWQSRFLSAQHQPNYSL